MSALLSLQLRTQTLLNAAVRFSAGLCTACRSSLIELTGAERRRSWEYRMKLPVSGRSVYPPKFSSLSQKSTSTHFWKKTENLEETLLDGFILSDLKLPPDDAGVRKVYVIFVAGSAMSRLVSNDHTSQLAGHFCQKKAQTNYFVRLCDCWSIFRGVTQLR
jgi:hypothetical protein